MYSDMFYLRQHTALIFFLSSCSFGLKKRLNRWVESPASAYRVEERSRSVVAPLLPSARVKDAGKWSPSVGLCGLTLQKQNKIIRAITVTVRDKYFFKSFHWRFIFKNLYYTFSRSECTVKMHIIYVLIFKQLCHSLRSVNIACYWIVYAGTMLCKIHVDQHFPNWVESFSWDNTCVVISIFESVCLQTLEKVTD